MPSMIRFTNKTHPKTPEKNIQTKLIDSLFTVTVAIEDYIHHLEKEQVHPSTINQLETDKAKLKEITKNILQIENKKGGTKKNQKRQRKTRKSQ